MPSPPKNPEPSDQVRSTTLGLVTPYMLRNIVASPLNGVSSASGIHTIPGSGGKTLGKAPDLKFSARPSAFFLLCDFDGSKDHGLSTGRFVKRPEREEHTYCA